MKPSCCRLKSHSIFHVPWWNPPFFLPGSLRVARSNGEVFSKGDLARIGIFRATGLQNWVNSWRCSMVSGKSIGKWCFDGILGRCTLWFHQTWLPGKSPVSEWRFLAGKITINGPWLPARHVAMFGDTGGYGKIQVQNAGEPLKIQRWWWIATNYLETAFFGDYWCLTQGNMVEAGTLISL